MRRHTLSRAGILLCAALAAGACADAPRATAPALPASDPLLERVVAMGFPRALIVDAGDRFVIDGDIVILKAELERADSPAAPEGPSYQYSTRNRINRYYLSVDYSTVAAQDTAWGNAIRQAMEAWTTVPGSAIVLNPHSGSSTPPNITIVFGTCEGTGATACATFPTSEGETGDTIIIQKRTETYKVYTVAHEIGHTLGFRHTNWNNQICVDGSGRLITCKELAEPYGAVHIPGTPTSTTGGADSDPNSVMNGGTARHWQGFSYYDRVAARYLFPGGAGPAATARAESGGARIDWPAMQDAVSYDVYWWEDICGYPCYYPSYSETHLARVTSTTYLDFSRGGDTTCGFINKRGYVVRANFPNGARTSWGAPGCF